MKVLETEKIKKEAEDENKPPFNDKEKKKTGKRLPKNEIIISKEFINKKNLCHLIFFLRLIMVFYYFIILIFLKFIKKVLFLQFFQNNTNFSPPTTNWLCLNFIALL